MNDMIYAVSLNDNSENFDLAAEMLSALEFEFSSWEDKENPRVVHSVYFFDEASRERRKGLGCSVGEDLTGE